MYIAIAGNIGAGKTTLTRMLARYYGWEPRFESVTYNPYLEDYYKDISRWSFCLETYFLKERFKDLLSVQRATHTIIQDRSLYEGVFVFVRNNYLRGDLSERDYTTYMELFNNLKNLIRLPDMLIYLRKSVPALIEQIQKRGRDYEQMMQIDYLKDLNERYEEFIYKEYEGRVLVIESDGLDFENRPEDFRKVLDKIDGELFGLFNEQTKKKKDKTITQGINNKQTKHYAHSNSRKHRLRQDDTDQYACQALQLDSAIRVGGLQSVFGRFLRGYVALVFQLADILSEQAFPRRSGDNPVGRIHHPRQDYLRGCTYLCPEPSRAGIYVRQGL